MLPPDSADGIHWDYENYGTILGAYAMKQALGGENTYAEFPRKWLVPEDRIDVPKDAYSTNGNRGQFTVVVPSHDPVIVRRGLDYGRQGLNQWDLTREVLKAVEL
jgi:hypothetical protein